MDLTAAAQLGMGAFALVVLAQVLISRRNDGNGVKRILERVAEAQERLAVAMDRQTLMLEQQSRMLERVADRVDEVWRKVDGRFSG